MWTHLAKMAQTQGRVKSVTTTTQPCTNNFPDLQQHRSLQSAFCVLHVGAGQPRRGLGRHAGPQQGPGCHHERPLVRVCTLCVCVCVCRGFHCVVFCATLQNSPASHLSSESMGTSSVRYRETKISSGTQHSTYTHTHTPHTRTHTR